MLHHESLVYYHYAPIVETRERGHTCTVWIQVSIIRTLSQEYVNSTIQTVSAILDLGTVYLARSPCRLASIEEEFHIQARPPIAGSPVDLPYPVCPCRPCHSSANMPILLKARFAIGICPAKGGSRLPFNQDRFVPSLALCFYLFDLRTRPSPNTAWNNRPSAFLCPLDATCPRKQGVADFFWPKHGRSSSDGGVKIRRTDSTFRSMKCPRLVS